MRWFFVVCVSLGLLGCANQFAFESAGSVPDKIQIESTIKGLSATIHYLGVGGFAIEVNGHRLMTAPFYSHIPIWQLTLPASENRERIDAQFPLLLRDGAKNSNIRAIIAGHGHYDHLMDVPYLMQQHTQHAVFVGSLTSATQINSKLGLRCDDRTRVRVVSPGKFTSVGPNLRIYAAKSLHAPHFLGKTFMTGTRSCDEETNLKTPWDWKMGENFAYLIDVLSDDGSVLFRVFHQDAASDPDTPVFPKDVLEEKSIDVATIVLAGYEMVDDYPQSIVQKTRAQLYLVGHWESFFSFNNPPSITPTRDFVGFVERMNSAVDNKWMLLQPGVSIEVVTR